MLGSVRSDDAGPPRGGCQPGAHLDAREIDVTLDQDEGHLRLDCGDAPFVRLRDSALAEVSDDHRVHVTADSVRTILVRRRSTLREATGETIRNRVVMVVGAFVLAVAAAIETIGLYTIGRWVLEFGG